MNSIKLSGRLATDPRHFFTKANEPIAYFTLACKRSYKKDDKPYYISCRAFNKVAELINGTLQKGRSILVDGRLSTFYTEGKDGKNISKYYVDVISFEYCDGNKDAKTQQPSTGSSLIEGNVIPDTDMLEDMF